MVPQALCRPAPCP